MNDWITHNIWLVPVAPIVAALLILGFGKRARHAAAGVAVLGQVIALTVSICALGPTLWARAVSLAGWRL